MAGGENWVAPTDIADIFFKFKCHATNCAEALGISRPYFYEILERQPEIKRQFEEVRASLKNEWLDQAERVMWQSLDLSKSKPGHAFRAATYVLNSKGKERGWNPVATEDNQSINVNIKNYS